VKTTLGAVGFSSRRANFLSRAIRWFTQSRWSHVFVVYQQEPEQLIIEASTFQVQLVPIAKYDSKKYDVMIISADGFSPEDVRRGLDKAKGYIEKTYGWLQLVGFIPVLFWKRLTGQSVPNPAKGGVVCSELVLQYLRGLEPGGRWDSMDRNSVSPEDLASELSKYEKFRVVEQT